jgi:hypothetical protein
MASRESESEYRKYAAQMEKALQSFDGITEWQDIIGFLQRVLKLLQSFKFSEIPQKLVLAKRLAQTLNPALPSGVHQKSLLVYQAIFETTGVHQYSKDLGLWSMGLFPFCQHASMSVKVFRNSSACSFRYLREILCSSWFRFTEMLERICTCCIALLGRRK